MASLLSVSFLYGEFNAVVTEGGQVRARWSPSASDRSHGWHEGAFRFYLERALEETGYDGEEVSLAIADVEMEHLTVGVPPTRPRLRMQLLEQEVARRAEGSAMVWSHTYLGSHQPGQVSVDGGGGGGQDGTDGLAGSEQYLLHLWPQHKLRQYLDDITAVGLVPRTIVPLALLMLDWARRRPGDEAGGSRDPSALLVRRGNGSMLMLCGAAGYPVLFRHLTQGVGQSAARLGAEVRRSLQYGQQNFRLQPRRLHVSDETLVRELGLALSGRPRVLHEAAWQQPGAAAEWVAAIPRNASESMVPVALRNARRNRLIDRVVKVALVVLVVVSLVVFGVVEWQVRQRQGALAAGQERADLLQAEVANLEREIDHLRQRNFFVARYADGQPLLLWLMRDLGRKAPPLMKLRAFKLVVPPTTRFDGGRTWADLGMELGLQTTELSRVEHELADFAGRLAAPPWYLQLPEGWRESWREQYLSGQLADKNQLLKIEITGSLPW